MNEIDDLHTFPEVMDMKQAAKYLGISYSHLCDLKAERSVPFFKVGRCIRFRKSTLDAWIEKQEKKNGGY